MRIAKNARNKLSSEDGTGVGTDTAPSYFLESLLWNVPDERYGGNVENAYRQVVEWLNNDSSPLGQMNLPSRTGKLFGTAPDTSWTKSSARTIISAMYAQLNS